MKKAAASVQRTVLKFIVCVIKVRKVLSGPRRLNYLLNTSLWNAREPGQPEFGSMSGLLA